jgi:hypothetical protein
MQYKSNAYNNEGKTYRLIDESWSSLATNDASEGGLAILKWANTSLHDQKPNSAKIAFS